MHIIGVIYSSYSVQIPWLVQYDMVIEADHRKYVHHMVFYGCKDENASQYVDAPDDCHAPAFHHVQIAI